MDEKAERRFYFNVVFLGFVKWLAGLPLGPFTDKNDSKKAQDIFIQAVRETFPDENPYVKSLSTMYKTDGRFEIKIAAYKKFKSYLEPKGFSVPEILAISSLAYDNGGFIDHKSYAIQAHFSSHYNSLGLSEDEVINGFSELERKGYIYRRRDRRLGEYYELSRKLDDVLSEA